MMHLGDEHYYFTLPPSDCQFYPDSMYNESYPPIESNNPAVKKSTAKKIPGNGTKFPKDTSKSATSTQHPRIPTRTISVALSPTVYVVRKVVSRGNAGHKEAGGGSGSNETSEEKVISKAYVKLS